MLAGNGRGASSGRAATAARHRASGPAATAAAPLTPARAPLTPAGTPVAVARAPVRFARVPRRPAPAPVRGAGADPLAGSAPRPDPADSGRIRGEPARRCGAAAIGVGAGGVAISAADGSKPPDGAATGAAPSTRRPATCSAPKLSEGYRRTSAGVADTA